MIFTCDGIETQTKFALLISATMDEIELIFKEFEQINNDNHSWITVVSLWFDNLSFLVQEYPQNTHSPIIVYINQCISEKFVMNELFRTYLAQLQQSSLSPFIFTCKQQFYMQSITLFTHAPMLPNTERENI